MEVIHFQYYIFCTEIESFYYTNGSQPGVPEPLGVQNKIFGRPKCDLQKWEFVCSWLYSFSKEPRFMKACKCYYPKQHYLAK